jgi:hypothetical protein
MDQWENEHFNPLVQEAIRCNRPFNNRRQPKRDHGEHNKRVFSRLMFQGKTRAAMRWLTSRSKGSVLLPNDMTSVKVNGTNKSVSVFEALKMKHPQPRLPHSSSLLNPPTLPLLEDIDVTGAHVGMVAHPTQGSAGPTGCDSSHWQDALLHFGKQSERLCDSVAELIWCLANSLIDWPRIQALLANRLIALDKSPGVRPIGVGETLRRTIGKSVCLLTRNDVEDVCGTNQLCAGLKCGIEGAIHATNDLFQDGDVGMLIMDAHNAFNSINRLSLLWNVRILWPRASRHVFNTYRDWSSFILKGCEDVIYSTEGVIQGDPLSMFLYATATLPLIHELEEVSILAQLWYADDSSAIGDLALLRAWCDLLLTRGPYYGYFPETQKCSLIVKETLIEEARHVFNDLGVKVVTGCEFLGSIIGDVSSHHEFISSKVDDWDQYVKLLSSIAEDQPQAAYIALSKSLQSEWSFLQRVTPDCGQLFQPIELSLSSIFIPALFGQSISSMD